MYDQPYVTLVNTHSKGRGGNDDVDLTIHEGILVGYLFVRVHLAVVWQGSHPITAQFEGKLFGALGTRNIDDGRTVGSLNK